MVTSGEREGRRGKTGVEYFEEQTVYKIDKQQGYIVQHREYSHYFVVTLSGVKSIKVLNHYVVHLKLIYFKSTILQFKKKKRAINKIL